jgi:zinc transporter ZupT
MNKYLFPIYAVLIGYVIVLFAKQKPVKGVKLLLAFSGAFLLSLTVFNPLPEVYEHLDAKLAGSLIMAGITLQIFLEFFSKGAEHGHIHKAKEQGVFPWLLFGSLCLHAFLEGFPIHQHNDLVYGVLVHKIPIAILITTFFIGSGFSHYKTIVYLVLFAFMTPMGTFISNETTFLGDYIYYINALVIGIFLHISTIILFESSEGHQFNLNKLLAIISAVAIAFIM